MDLILAQLCLLGRWLNYYVAEELRTFLRITVRTSFAGGFTFHLHVVLVESLWKVPDSASVRAHIVAENEVPENPKPRGVVRQTVVELCGDATDLRQAVIRNVRKVVVLDVVAEIVDEEVQRTVVAGGCLARHEEIVLRDEVSGQRMKTQTEQGTGQKVDQRLDAEEVEDQRVEADLDEEVDHFEGENRNRILDERTDAVDGRMHGQPEQLGRPVTEHATLERGRNVDVLHVVPAVNNTPRLEKKCPQNIYNFASNLMLFQGCGNDISHVTATFGNTPSIKAAVFWWLKIGRAAYLLKGFTRPT